MRMLIVGLLVVFGTLMTLAGCSGPSKEETAKKTEEGKKTNEEAMMRMLNEQGIRNPQTSGTNR